MNSLKLYLKLEQLESKFNIKQFIKVILLPQNDEFQTETKVGPNSTWDSIFRFVIHSSLNPYIQFIVFQEYDESTEQNDKNENEKNENEKNENKTEKNETDNVKKCSNSCSKIIPIGIYNLNISHSFVPGKLHHLKLKMNTKSNQDIKLSLTIHIPYEDFPPFQEQSPIYPWNFPLSFLSFTKLHDLKPKDNLFPIEFKFVEPIHLSSNNSSEVKSSQPVSEDSESIYPWDLLKEGEQKFLILSNFAEKAKETKVFYQLASIASNTKIESNEIYSNQIIQCLEENNSIREKLERNSGFAYIPSIFDAYQAVAKSNKPDTTKTLLLTAKQFAESVACSNPDLLDFAKAIQTNQDLQKYESRLDELNICAVISLFGIVSLQRNMEEIEDMLNLFDFVD